MEKFLKLYFLIIQHVYGKGTEIDHGLGTVVAQPGLGEKINIAVLSPDFFCLLLFFIKKVFFLGIFLYKYLKMSIVLFFIRQVLGLS
jgi:hypothetical protein